MKVNFIFKGTIECSKCGLVFVPNSKIFKGLDEIIGDVKSVSLDGFCPECDNKLKTSFKVEKITREFNKTYTMRC
ncbi:hypothetical protein RLQ69_001794 [Campylobacter jejuni]|uniref:Uncharacterized protein n=1 Tax=Campylobacter jejuni TaxID=197 RepID=A0A690VA18_CAMJU|nr:hypothetical protein [Campylobacter jejuni]EAJ5194505.1 hypothetical protein [Campylobacter jejuni]EAK0574115.1 hypothetical protein [Campylobacter jejuni]EDP7703032.1 hypothetical protein [Campylobacter jejuni]EDP8234647.1 hypothetical protein [Campylobacter jejuni]EFV4333610.1 hypothetical protein [Campylobacter jejuni]